MKPNNYQGVLSNIREAEAKSATLDKYVMENLSMRMKEAKRKYDASQALQLESWEDASGHKLIERIGLLESALRDIYIFLEVNLRDELEALDVPEL